MNVYKQNGYTDRQEYLESIADDYGVPIHEVMALADLLGKEEDFDGLVIALDEDTDYDGY